APHRPARGDRENPARTVWRKTARLLAVRLDAHSIPNAPINTIHEVFDDPQIKHMEIPKQITHPKMGASNLVGSPINMSGTPPKFFRAAPLLGENTDEVLAKLGYDDNAVKDLRANGVI
ncbi:MAG: CoA transferase, partial [Candidatus Binatia bacterium]|nr:CoA transferase [Candidatus Binatia bacterium]